jgi:hypothetical protein
MESERRANGGEKGSVKGERKENKRRGEGEGRGSERRLKGEKKGSEHGEGKESESSLKGEGNENERRLPTSMVSSRGK